MSEDQSKEQEVIQRPALITGGQDFKSVDEIVFKPMEIKPPAWWIIAFTAASSLALLLMALVGLLVKDGTGIWGVNNPVYWGYAIVNMVFWLGIGHAGTLISAILFLFRQKWRTSINRFAEAMTLFAVSSALVFPAVHIGRQWLAYWFMPIPNQMALWPNFRSPLLWDFVAISTYGLVSAVFWFVGLIPDLANYRDRTDVKWKQIVFGILAMGWRGANRHWQNYEKVYLILAGVATPLVVSVHSIVSFDFAVSQLPGWHTTIFPPYFVAGAIFSGFGMVVTLSVIMRKVFNMKDFITINHLETMNKIILLTGTIVGYAYAMEFFMAWYSGWEYEQAVFFNTRALGPYAWAYWTMVSCNLVFPQLFWFKKIRRSVVIMWIISIIVNIGMWFERFVIVITSLHRDYLPSSWEYYVPTWVDVGMLVGSFGLFFTLLLIFVKVLPVIAISEVKGVMPQADPHFGEKEDH